MIQRVTCPPPKPE
jgi:hypothetical protein